MNKSAVLFVNFWWSQLTSTSYSCELFVNMKNLNQEIVDYLVANIWSRSIPHSEYGLWIILKVSAFATANRNVRIAVFYAWLPTCWPSGWAVVPARCCYVGQSCPHPSGPGTWADKRCGDCGTIVVAASTTLWLDFLTLSWGLFAILCIVLFKKSVFSPLIAVEFYTRKPPPFLASYKLRYSN
jgi:hypothetical protein